MVNIIGITVVFLKDISKMVYVMVQEFGNVDLIQRIFMKENMLMIKNVVKAFLLGHQEILIKVSISMI